MPEQTKNTAINLTVAGQNINLDFSKTAIKLHIPPSHKKFLIRDTAEAVTASAVINPLNLALNDQRPPVNFSDSHSLCLTEIWELWQNTNGEFIFYAPRLIPLRWAIMDQYFTKGTLYGEFTALNGDAVYPLQNIDMRIFVNWLANKGDLILHASGIALNGKGYGFVGPSGSGKSTLAEALAKEKDVTVLGEDQVVLRYFKGGFWIYGTPWHERPAMCSPMGVPLEKLFILNRQNSQDLSSISPTEVILGIMRTAFIPYYRPDRVAAILDSLALLPKQIPCFALSYRIGSDVLSTILSV